MSHYGTDEKVAVGEEKVALEQEKVAFEAKKIAFGCSVLELKLNKPTKDSIMSLSENFRYDVPFSRADVIELCNLAPFSAGKIQSRPPASLFPTRQVDRACRRTRKR